MKVGIMQPYFMPYIGYWQLIHAVDKFVILDDVNYIMRGYINRNSILLDGKPYRFTIPIEKASQNRLIMETKIHFTEDGKRGFMQTIGNAYRNAPHYGEVLALLEDIVNNQDRDLTGFVKRSIEKVMGYLGMRTEILVSSKIEKRPGLKGEDRIIEICQRLRAQEYINAIGGMDLYSFSHFNEKGIKLQFIKMADIKYSQYGEDFVKDLSIIDAMMFHSAKEVRGYLKDYTMIGGEGTWN